MGRRNAYTRPELPRQQGIGVWVLEEAGRLGWEGIGPCDMEVTYVPLGRGRKGCLFPLSDSVSFRWDSHKMEKSNLHGTVTWGRRKLDVCEDTEIWEFHCCSAGLISLANIIINSHSWIMFRGYSWAKSNQGAPRGSPSIPEQDNRWYTAHSLTAHWIQTMKCRFSSGMTSLWPTPHWLDLKTWLCLIAMGEGSAILLGAWKERKSRYGWALHASLSTVLGPPS